jgi:general secretion pathway protein G
MAKRTGTDRGIYFLWDRRGGAFRRLGLHRAPPFVLVLMLLGFAALVGVEERERAGIRRTRATLLSLRRAIDSFLADNGGDCPTDLAALVDYGGFRVLPVDAWGRPFRLTCPGRQEGDRYDLASDGPDGKAGGLDRIE